MRLRLLFSSFFGSPGGYVMQPLGRGKNGSNKTIELRVDPLKKLPTSNMGIYSHHSLERSKSIVAETSHRGVGGSISEYVIV